MIPSKLLALSAALLALPAPARGAGRPVMAIAAAANLRPALEPLVSTFLLNHRVEVKIAYGASGALAAQVEQGAPFDLFLSADAEFPARLAAMGLGDGAPFRYARGRMVLWLPPGSPLDVRARGLRALLDPSVEKVALANPRLAPYGRAAEAELRRAGVWEGLEGRRVLGSSVSQVAQFAASGAVQAAFLPRSLALEPALAAGAALPAGDERLPHDGLVLRAARQKGLARAFARFLASAQGRALLEKHGYEPGE